MPRISSISEMEMKRVAQHLKTSKVCHKNLEMLNNNFQTDKSYLT